ncbi:MAG TPA: sulfite exporter TauE/SafE family protein [Gemmatimonadaceae bacterium]|nr:sulfite exporter TauE/SafE family protein [Gemmatimonadaceae bacterium]
MQPCGKDGESLASQRAGWAAPAHGEVRIDIWQFALLAVIGVAVGTYGTLVGLGGGFLVVPLLLLVYNLSPPAAAATSLVVVFLNAASGSAGYLSRRRVDVRAGLILALGTIPGALIGPAIAVRIPQRAFELVFATFLIGMAAFLVARPQTPSAIPSSLGGDWFRVRRTFTDAAGSAHSISFSAPLALAISFVVGIISSLLGIGGGVIHVPAMIHLMGFPVHIATATATFVLSTTALTAVLEYTRRGLVNWPLAIALGVGVVVGAQLGAAVSHRIHARWLVRLLTLAILGLGVRMLVEGG